MIEFGSEWCQPCRSLRKGLTERRVPHVYVNIEDPRSLATPEGRLYSTIPASHRGGIPITRVVQPNGAVVWINGCAPAAVENAYRGGRAYGASS